MQRQQHQKQQQQQQQLKQARLVLIGLIAMALAVESVSGVITVQIGGATRLTSLNRQRDRYNCYWDCDLVGCQIARDDDECAYDCEKICRVRYDYAAVGRSGTEAADASSDLRPKSADIVGIQGASEKAQQGEAGNGEQLPPVNELIGAGTSVRLHLPRNASARNFAIWERCSADSQTGKLTEKPFNL